MERDRETESEREMERENGESGEREMWRERRGHAYKNYNAYQFRITLEFSRLVHTWYTCSKMHKR